MSTIDYEAIAKKYNISPATVMHVAHAIQTGNGTQAQFNHPELGGSGQWMPGMVMIGDAFNQTLKAKVNNLCTELAEAYRANKLSDAPQAMSSMSMQWEDEFAGATMRGAQNDTRYAVFADQQRLIILRGGQRLTYALGDHEITGVAQQQSGAAQGLVFTTRRGTIAEVDLTQI